MVIEFGARFAGRYGVSALSLLLISTILAAVFSGSVNPVALFSLLSAWLLWKIVAASWNEYMSRERMLEARKTAYLVHFTVGIILAVSSLVAIFENNF
jgi:hypothetical protein